MKRFSSRIDAIARVIQPPAPVTAPAPTAARSRWNADGWENFATGFGTSQDKSAHGFFACNWELWSQMLSDMFYGDPLAAKIVSLLPQEAFRRGYCLESDASQPAADTLTDACEALDLNNKILWTAIWGRLFGGSLLVIGMNTGSDQSSPLPPGATGVRFLNTVDKRDVQIATYYEDIMSPKYGQPEIYDVRSQTGVLTKIHESRVIRFDGIEVDYRKKRELKGWSYSVLQRPYAALRDFANAFRSAQVLLSDASQGVFKIKGLVDMIAADEGPEVQKRMALVDSMRSALRSIILDADQEDFTRVTTQFAGIPDLLDRIMMMLSSATDIPVTLLMGRSAAGMNATGEGDARAFYDTVAAYQEKVLTPILRKLLPLIGTVPEDLEIEWAPLWEPSDQEKATTELTKAQVDKTIAETDAIYLSNQVVHPEEVALARFSDETDGEIEINIKAVNESLKNEIALALDPPEPATAPLPGATPAPGAPQPPPADPNAVPPAS